ncbi:AAA family ATPase [Amphibacillus xylanus]|uniref:Putative ATPase n=1 Tax=Amphibacillus xylanus (strain ATCC 51415 / DSM 6626 / JCM 7361 / LMG 17667 / NBRC 15112 / Ep01) TaxID=698758 RepID=K0J221_AMPXN|nr:MoxR family ATPase [Amphibacillus xylanus]BAM46521.1 putative ATPase [Amphibacillus xylanus NBRC 15112]
MNDHQLKINKLLNNINKVIIGKEDTVILSLTALLARGHVLLEDIPGVGKTMLVRALAKSMNCSFSRIQFTPDLLPSDVTGVSIYHPQKHQFEYKPGPIVGDIILADEINRTSPKTQSALLEAMEENSVTVDGQTIVIDHPFFVMATQNPIEYEGTYPLPEAQIDRFLLKLNMGYPTESEEVEMLELTGGVHPIETLTSVVDRQSIVTMQEEVNQVYLDRVIQAFIVKIVRTTREHPQVHLGVSPRGAIGLMKAAKAYAYINGRDYCIPDDIIYLAPFVLKHRLILTQSAKYDGSSPEQIIESILGQVEVPVRKEIY